MPITHSTMGMLAGSTKDLAKGSDPLVHHTTASDTDGLDPNGMVTTWYFP